MWFQHGSQLSASLSQDFLSKSSPDILRHLTTWKASTPGWAIWATLDALWWDEKPRNLGWHWQDWQDRIDGRFGGSGLWKGNPVILIPQCCSGLKSIEIFRGEDAKTIKNNLANLDWAQDKPVEGYIGSWWFLWLLTIFAEVAVSSWIIQVFGPGFVWFYILYFRRIPDSVLRHSCCIGDPDDGWRTMILYSIV